MIPDTYYSMPVSLGSENISIFRVPPLVPKPGVGMRGRSILIIYALFTFDRKI